jgi:hypothetical protein
MSAARWPYCDGNGWGAEIVKVGGAESTTRVVDPSKDDERALAVFAQTQVKLGFYQGRTWPTESSGSGWVSNQSVYMQRGDRPAPGQQKRRCLGCFLWSRRLMMAANALGSPPTLARCVH